MDMDSKNKNAKKLVVVFLLVVSILIVSGIIFWLFVRSQPPYVSNANVGPTIPLSVNSNSSGSNTNVDGNSITNVSPNADIGRPTPNRSSNMPTTIPTPTSHGGFSEVLINTSTLQASLKQRLMSDNRDLLTDADWSKDSWLDVGIGLFYKNDDEFSRDAVCKVATQILKDANKKMNAAAERRLRNNINRNTKGKVCVSEMLTAVLSTKAINPIP